MEYDCQLLRISNPIGSMCVSIHNTNILFAITMIDEVFFLLLMRLHTKKAFESILIDLPKKMLFYLVSQ